MSLLPFFYEAIQQEQYVKIGSFKKPIGKEGAIAALFAAGLDLTNLVKLPALFVERNCIKVPYTIQHITLAATKAIVQLVGISSKTAAYALQNLPLFLPVALEMQWVESTIPYHFLIGFFVSDKQLGTLGNIEAIYCMRDRYMMVINHQTKELLIPYHSPFVLELDKQEKRVLVMLPEGYLDAMLGNMR